MSALQDPDLYRSESPSRMAAESKPIRTREEEPLNAETPQPDYASGRGVWFYERRMLREEPFLLVIPRGVKYNFAVQELVLGQKVPPVAEGLASGPITGRIVRGTKRFKTELIRYVGRPLVFKDEERTGADALMTLRLAERLSALASRVSIEWPSIQLRVVEAWDENGEHHAASLHYEGRAADLTTSDRDAAKLGRLAALAVDAGFDWVFYENAAHVHVSVKREQPL